MTLANHEPSRTTIPVDLLPCCRSAKLNGDVVPAWQFPPEEKHATVRHVPRVNEVMERWSRDFRSEFVERHAARGLFLLALIASSGGAAIAADVTIKGRVLDENGVPVAGTRVSVFDSEAARAGGHSRAEVSSDAAGLFHLEIPAEGTYPVQAAHEGFFLFQNPSVNLDRDSPLEIYMNHLKELAERMDVRYSPPVIDPEQTSDTKRLQGEDILHVPVPASQDFRSSLPMMPSVLQDNSGQVHFNGGNTNQTNYRLNGFDVSDPATGNLTTRLNIDAVQTLEWEASRFSPEKGKGSAGTLDIRTQNGDNHWRFGGTNFVPGLGTQGGVYLNHWSPRVKFSGPIRKGRGWFHNAFDMYYVADTISDLPKGQNRAHSITGTNLTRLQWNVRENQILTASFLINRGNSSRTGLSFLDPAETTVNRRQSLLLGTIKDQFLIGGGLLEIGFANTTAFLRASPQGAQPYIITPFGASGNFFRDETRRSGRQEWLINGFIKPLQWWGTHQIQLGATVERSNLDELITRHDLSVVRANNSIVRDVHFLGDPRHFRTNVENYGYALDRWNPVSDLTIEAGFRTQWDQYTKGAPPAPRLAAAWAPKRLGGTKLSAGWGIFYDAITLKMLTLDQEQLSITTFYTPGGLPLSAPLETRFVAKPHDFRLPRYAITSFSAERRLRWNVYSRLNLTSREGSRGLSFAQNIVNTSNNVYTLENIERQRYRAAEFSVRGTFLNKY
ncbi:MAG: hypothetical protein QOJ99_6036, partial [Bryobacterales bacterium]|nr:hypothetical protein [Bryobacterales bacterium]